MKQTRKPKLEVTKDYRLFHRNEEGQNRDMELSRRKKLKHSMDLYGFLPSHPLSVHRNAKGQLVVDDGQHRLTFAEMLGLPVWYVVEEIKYDVAIVNDAQKPWTVRDYAVRWAKAGKEAYQEGMEFAESHSLPLGIAFALLAGYTSFTHIEPKYKDGSFEVKDRAWADAVAGIYVPLVTMAPEIKSATLVGACMAVCRVPTFESKRLLQGAKRCRQALVSYATRDAYLDMLQEVYNFGRPHLVDLKIQAVMAMRERNVAGNGKHRKAQEEVSA